MDVRLEDGTIVRGVPDNISKAELAAKLHSNGLDIPQETMPSPPVEQRSFGAELGRQAGLTARAVIKGVAAPGEVLGSAVGLDTAGAVDRAMKKVGIPEPETATERIVGGASESLVGAAVPLGAAKYAKPVTEMGKGIKTALTAQPASQAASAMASGSAGQTAKELDFGPAGQAMAALAAGALPFSRFGAGGVAQPRNLKEATFADAREHGYVATPTAVRDNRLSNFMESVTNKKMLTSRTSAINASARANDIRQEFGLGEGDHITPAELDAVRNNAYQAYENLIGKLKASKPHVTADGQVIPQGSVPPTPEFKATIKKIVNESVKLSDRYPKLAEAPLRRLMERKEAELFQYHDPEDAVALVKNLREQASANLSAPTGQKVGPRNQALGQFQYKAANAIEKLMEESLKDPEAVAAMKQARKIIAQTYDVQYALNPATGEVSGQRLAQRLKDGSPMTGALRRAANFFEAFKPDNKEMSRVGGVPSYSAWDFLVAGGTAMSGHPGLAIAELAGRGFIPPVLASNRYQNTVVGGGGQSGLSAALINALFQGSNR